MKTFALASLCVVATSASRQNAPPKCSAKCGSEIGFTSADGPELILSYDGDKLTIPQHCREEDCAAHAAAIKAMESENEKLRAELTGVKGQMSSVLSRLALLENPPTAAPTVAPTPSPTPPTPAPTPYCDTSTTPTIVSEDKGQCASSGAPTSCQSASGWFCCHAHKYRSGHKPHEGARVTYHLSEPARLNHIDVSQHGNGVNCIEAFLDGRSLGEVCPHGHRRGGGRYGERQQHSFNGFDRSITGTELRLQVTDTSLSNGWAMYMIRPSLGNGCP